MKSYKLNIKISWCFFCLLMISNPAFTQIKVLNNSDVIVGTNSQPESSAKLEVNSETQGFLAPRMSDAQRAGILNPADGLLVYVTDPSDDIRGFYYYDAEVSAWLKLFGGCNLTP